MMTRSIRDPSFHDRAGGGSGTGSSCGYGTSRTAETCWCEGGYATSDGQGYGDGNGTSPGRCFEYVVDKYGGEADAAGSAGGQFIDPELMRRMEHARGRLSE